ncbi:MAG: energy transducer TonB [Chryseotalea sp.]|jgi:protein TonB
MTKIKITLLLITLTILTLNAQEQTNDTSKTQVEVFIPVEKTAEFPGGITKLYTNYIDRKLKYPKDARREGIKGKVFVEFVINKDGSIDDSTVKVVQGLNESCNNEAIRVIKECPNWIPATINNKPVKQKFVIPINFNP